MAEVKKPTPQAEAADSGKKAKSNTMLYVVIALLALLVLGGVVAGAAYFLLFRDTASQVADDNNGSGDDQSADKPKKAKVKEEKKQSDEPPIFEKLDVYTVNLQGGTVLQTEIQVRVASDKQKELVKSFLPHINSEVILLLRSKKPEEIATVDGTKKLMGEVKQTVNKALGAKTDEEGVMSVEFKSFIVQ